MQAIINVELDDKALPGYSIEDKYQAVINKVRGWFVHCVGEIRNTGYVNNEDEIVEATTAVISIEFAGSKETFEMAMHQLCTQFNQDCVAVLYSDGQGILAGPKSQSWGAFNFEYFTVPSMYELLAA
ncbi:hypothetical protein [Polynucleobacter sp. UK-Kesae-W10]|uniref:hypothetical protein n=1 Tax=Polynucleobacter sp. UK-Kesae-W10 TaxID=1819738 RepID=UPI001C0C1777|nr:hypothetical protein [Polynucleobacter sp. UK-Kesae-W10]MBU3577541.1 hypothetical protein [Polynucleobacter sp. UK-Kesae-W10]